MPVELTVASSRNFLRQTPSGDSSTSEKNISLSAAGSASTLLKNADWQYFQPVTSATAHSDDRVQIVLHDDSLLRVAEVRPGDE